MEKKYFALKLLPKRLDFMQTMTADERGIMMQHIAYWHPYVENGTMLVMGPVLDPKGAYGLGIICVQSEDEMLELIKHDPGATINTYEYYPMMAKTK